MSDLMERSKEYLEAGLKISSGVIWEPSAVKRWALLIVGHLEGCHDALRRSADTIESLTAENTMLRALLARYRKETPLGHQPHMIAGEVDEALGALKEGAK